MCTLSGRTKAAAMTHQIRKLNATQAPAVTFAFRGWLAPSALPTSVAVVTLTSGETYDFGNSDFNGFALVCGFASICDCASICDFA